MDSTIRETKAALRVRLRKELKLIPEKARVADSERARLLLKSTPAWRESRSILFFAPLPGELDIWPLLTEALADGKQIALPRFDPETARYEACEIKKPDDELETGRFGIREPRAHCPKVSLNQLDFVLVPGIAFDLHGRRLGRGKGFYDRMLADVRGNKCGVAFDNQVLHEIPVEPHDARVNCILTPTRWLVV
jgi:5-formyltetrahydrofolate cyclo-ligase